MVPGVTQVQHPRYFGWFPSNATLSSALGDLATAGLGALGITWQSAPALTEVTVKSHVKNILAKLGANDRTHAVTIALKRGIIDL